MFHINESIANSSTLVFQKVSQTQTETSCRPNKGEGSAGIISCSDGDDGATRTDANLPHQDDGNSEIVSRSDANDSDCISAAIGGQESDSLVISQTLTLP